MAVTIRELSRAAGVSVATVSRALNNSDHPINPETKQRILDLAQSMGYYPNHAARSLRTDRSPIIGIICDDITSVFTTAIVRGIQDRLKNDGYFCIVINTDWDPASEQRAIRDLAGHSIEGIIFAETTHQSANLELNIEDTKYVFVHRLFPHGYANSVIPDEMYGSRLAVNHLISLGHRRIGHIMGSKEFFASEERLQGYRAELEQAGIPFDPTLVEPGAFNIQEGYNATLKLLDHAEPPTAIFAASDMIALGVIYAAQDRGLRVPDDLALVGYDDREISRIARPTITTVTLPCFEMGQASAEHLLALIRDEATSSEEIRVKGKLIVRESSGAALEGQSPAAAPRSRVERLRELREQRK